MWDYHDKTAFVNCQFGIIAQIIETTNQRQFLSSNFGYPYTLTCPTWHKVLLHQL